MIRPEFGALAGAVVVWLLFAWQAGDTWLSWQGTATYLDAAALYGVSALAVALLMIGGEFDLSSGVIVGTTGMFAGLFAVHAGWHVGVSLLVSLAHRRRHRRAQRRDGRQVAGCPSFIVTLGVFFALRGFNLWLTQQVTDQTQVDGIENADGYSSPASCSPPTSCTSAAPASRCRSCGSSAWRSSAPGC